MISIHDFKTKRCKKYYGASRRVYRQSHVDRLITMWSDLHYLHNASKLTRITPRNDEFYHKKAVPIFNETLLQLQKKYPNIKEFHDLKYITKPE